MHISVCGAVIRFARSKTRADSSLALVTSSKMMHKQQSDFFSAFLLLRHLERKT